jgi:hypothetical protein
LAQKINLLAHDSKSDADCLLNVDGRLQPAGFRLRDLRCGISFVPKTGERAASVHPAPKSLSDAAILRDSTMCMKSSQTSGRLRVTQAYIALSGIPERDAVPRTISVVRLGKCEIRMFNNSSDVPLLWIELIDHDAQLAVDSCICREIDDAVAAFEEFALQAATLNEARGPDAGDARV